MLSHAVGSLWRFAEAALRGLGTERGSVQAIGWAATTAKTRHRLHESGDLT
jgi:hypothetical protein